MHILAGWIRFHFIIDGIFQANGFQRCRNFACNPALDQKFVSYYERFLQIQLLDLGTDVVDTAFAHDIDGRNIIHMRTHNYTSLHKIGIRY